MSSLFPDPKPHWLRLSDEAWDEIGRAYCDGATAKELAHLWKVSPKTIYRKAKQKGWSKRRDGDAIVRAAQDGKAPSAKAAGYFRLDEATWAEIGEAFCNGATAEALGVQFGVSASTILLHARRRGWQPHRNATPADRAAATQEVLPPENQFAPDSRIYLDRYMAKELFDPGFAAQLAASASCGAMLVGDLQQSLVLAQIAYAHARIVKLNPSTTREMVWEAISNPVACDDLFSHTRRDGEEELKREYWQWRMGERGREREQREALRAAEARIAELGAR